MSQENVEVVGSVWDAWNRGDLEGILDGISPESEFHPSGRFMDTQRVYRGREEYVDFWREFRAAWEEITIGIERIEDLAIGVLVFGTFQGNGGQKGLEGNAAA